MLFLRYDEILYDKFLEIKNTIKELIPKYKQNIYLDKYTTDIYKILLELIDKEVTCEELELIAQNFIRISKVNK